jgi:acetoin utilization protein AcuB
MLVQEIMTQNPFTLTRDHRLYHALNLMQEKMIRHVIVVENDILLGIVSDRDLKYSIHQESTKSLIIDRMFLLLTLDNVMSSDVLTCRSTDSTSEAAVMMLNNRISALPVVSEDEPPILEGILTTTDLMKTFSGKAMSTS